MVVGLLVGGAVAGVRVVTRDSSASSGGPADAVRPVPEGTPRAVAEEFAARWTAGDLDRLYGLVAPPVQPAYPLAAFRAVYAEFAIEVTQTSVTASVKSVDGQTAVLAVHLETAYFGPFEYSTTLNLINTGGRWLVNWQPTAVHPDMTGGKRFESTIEKPKRGAILDRSGQPLAVTRDIRMLGLNRSIVSDRPALTAALTAFGFEAAAVDGAFASTAGASQRVGVGPIPDDRADEAAALRSFQGVIIYFETQRVHPLAAAAAHVVGYTRELTAEELTKRAGQGFRPGDRVGAAGLEASLDERLAGLAGAELKLVDGAGDTVAVLQSRPLVPGQDVTTTLDANVLVTAAARLGSRAGAIVVIDPVSNAILGLNSSPSFDPDAFERGDRAGIERITAMPQSPQANRATAGLYSAGSTFKVVTGAAGLASGGYRTTDQIFCGATWDGVSPARRNWEGTQGPLTIAEGLMRSCNPVFYEIALKLYNDGEGALSEMARSFGFGTATGVGVLSEEDGQVPDAAWKKAKRGEQWFPGDEVNLGIGQGDLLITPLQLANAYSTLVNLELRTPVILAGQAMEARGKLSLTDAQAAHLRLGLKLVTSVTGTARQAFADAGYFDFAGKSGTAEDLGTQQHVLFVAFSPAAAPRALAAVVLDEGQSGSIEAGPIARDVVLAALGGR